MADDIVIIIKATDDATAALKKVEGAMDKLGGTTGKTQSAWGKLKTDVPGLSSVLNLATNPIVAVTAGLGAAAALVKSSVGDWVNYNTQIKEMSQVTGLAADETSRIVQVADDWAISIDTVQTALSLMNKNGVTPSIDNLADLADKYVNSTDKTEFAAEATKLLGRNYAALIPMLAKGGDALRAQAAAVDSNMIATEDTIKVTEEYRLAVDTLGDTWTGVKNVIGADVLPVLNDLLAGTIALIDRNKQVTDTANKLEIAHKAGAMTDQEYATARHALMFETDGLLTANVALTAANKDQFAAVTMAYPEEEKFIGLYQALKMKIPPVSDAIDVQAAAAEAAAAANELYKGKLSALYGVINGDLGPELADFAATQGDLNTQMADVQTQINDATAKYGAQSSQVADLNGQMDDLSGAYDANAAAHEAATKRIIFDMLAQRAGMDGLTSDEYAVLSATAVSWGLVDQATANAGLAIDTTLQKLGSGDTDVQDAITSIQAIGTNAVTSGDGFATAMANAANSQGLQDILMYVDNLNSDVDNIAGKHEVEFHSTMSGNWPQGGGGGITGALQSAGGADYIVPPGYDNDRWPLGFAESGERVVIIPKNQQSQITNNFSMTVHTNAGISTLQNDYNIMKSKAG